MVFFQTQRTLMMFPRNLTKENTKLIWANTRERAFQKLKELISRPPYLKYYDSNKEVSIETDSSELSMGAVITQGRKSCSLCQQGINSHRKEIQ